MRLFRLALLTTVMVSTLSPVIANPSADEIADKIRHVRAAPTKVVKEEEPKGWFSSFRNSVGNGFRKAGDYLRREEDASTPAAHVAQATKEAAASAIAAKTNLPVTTRAFNYIGNGLRSVGQWIKGGEETQTPTRVVLNNLGLNKSAGKEEISYALNTAARAVIKADPKTAPEAFLDVVKGLNNRGHATKEIDVYGIYVKALSDEILAQNADMSLDSFSNNLKAVGLKELEKVTAIENASSQSKSNAMNKVVRDIYNQKVAEKAANKLRNEALASPAA